MTVALHRGGPDDYDVIHDGEIVGRIYRMKADRELWRWMIPELRARRMARTAGWPIASTRPRRRSGRRGTRVPR